VLYTFLKFLGWGILLAVIGGCIGWALRSLKCRSEVARVRATTVDADELERMRHRLANMEQIVEERNRLRMQVADMRHADSPGLVHLPGDVSLDPIPPVEEVLGDTEPDTVDTVDAADDFADDAPDDGRARAGAEEGHREDDGNSSEAAGDLVTDGEPDGETSSTVPAGFVHLGESPEEVDVTSDDVTSDDVELDLAAAAAVLGKKVRLDDLSVVEGIGPKISELCRGIGIETWRGLAATDVATLRSMLDAAGSRFQVHKPDTWPTQAGLLAGGRWAEFKQLTDDLDGGR
jgi:predicted flap endonuclease-1-like 5' DNA nuclease